MADFNIGDDYTIREDGDDLVLEHEPTGATFAYDAAANEWQLGDTLNANNEDIDNVGALSTEEAVIDKATYAGHTFNFFVDRDTDIIYARDANGELVAGGDEHLGVSDAEDFGEVLQHVVNDVAEGMYSIKLGTSKRQQATYSAKTTASLNKVGAIWGSGKNRTFISHDGSLADDTVIEITDPDSEFIFRMDSIKFSHGTEETQPDRWLFLDGQREVLLTNVEFADANNWGVEAINSNINFNYITNCWFIRGAGLRVQDFQDLILTGNRITAHLEIKDSTGVVRAGNIIEGGQTFDNVIFQKVDGEFTRHMVSGDRLTRFYDDLDDAIDDWGVGETLRVAPGIHEPIATQGARQTLIGTKGVRFDAEDGDAITISHQGCTVRNVDVRASGSSGEHGIKVDALGATLQDLEFRSVDGSHIYVTPNGDRCLVDGAYRIQAAGGDSIVFENGAEDGIVDNYRNAGAITDNDGSNVEGTTT